MNASSSGSGSGGGSGSALASRTAALGVTAGHHQVHEDEDQQHEDDPILLELSQLSQQRAADLAQFRHTRQTLEAEVARQRAISEEREAKCQRLECDLAKANREIMHLSQQCIRAEHAESQLVSVQSECARLSEELKNAKKSKAAAVQRVKGDMHELEKRTRILNDQRAQLLHENKRQTQLITALQAQLSEVQQQLDVTQHSETTAKAKSSELMRRADLASEGEQAALNALNAAHDKIAALETQLRDMEDKHTRTVATLNSKINKLLPLQARPAITQEQYREQCQAANDMQQEIRSLRANLELKESEVVALTQSGEALKKQLAVALDISASLEEHSKETQDAARAPEEALSSLSAHVSRLQQQLDDAHRRRRRDNTETHGAVMRATHLAAAVVRSLGVAHTKMMAATNGDSTSTNDASVDGRRGLDGVAGADGAHGSVVGGGGYASSNTANTSSEDDYDDTGDGDGDGDGDVSSYGGGRRRRDCSGRRGVKSVLAQLGALAAVMKKVHVMAGSVESRVERFRQQQTTERTKLEGQLRESWDVIRSQESALMERERAITSLRQQAEALRSEAFDERQAFAEEKRNLMQHLGRLEAQSTELRDLQNDHVKQLMELRSILKDKESTSAQMRASVLAIFDTPQLLQYRPDPQSELTECIHALSLAVRSVLEDSGVQRELYDGHIAEKTAQIQLLKEQLKSVEEHAEHVQHQLSVAGEQLAVASKQRQADTQRQEEDGAMIFELQNRLVSAMRTLQQEQAACQELQQNVDALTQRWKSEWQSCHTIIGGMRKVGLSLCDRIARILAVARCTGPVLSRSIDCVVQTNRILKYSSPNSDRACWSLKSAALVVVACRRLAQRRSLLDPDVVAASWRRSYRPRTPTHEHVEDMDDLDDDELLHHAGKHVDVANQMLHLKELLFDDSPRSSVTEDMRPVRTASDYLYSLMGAFGVEVPSRLGLRLMTWYPQRRVLCDTAQRFRLRLLDLKSKQHALATEVDDLKDTNANLHSKNKRQAQELASITARVQELDATNHRIYQELSELSQSHIEASAYYALKRQLEEAQARASQVEPLSETNARQERMIKQMQTELYRKETALETRVAELTDELKQAVEQAEALREEMEQQQSAFSEKEGEFEVQIRHLKQSKAALLHELKQLDGAVVAPSEHSVRSRPSTAPTEEMHYRHAVTHSTPMPFAQWVRRNGGGDGSDNSNTRAHYSQHQQHQQHQHHQASSTDGIQVSTATATRHRADSSSVHSVGMATRDVRPAYGGGDATGDAADTAVRSTTQQQQQHHHLHHQQQQQYQQQQQEQRVDVSQLSNNTTRDSGISEVRRRLHKSMLGQLSL
ncbi:hypothetical protein PTSG_12540 [Salpingoeca rosetta]|uniref:Uncharacterized protein n=1 Tax=Salpingoeca rosetta (strain ATCC 50818 / BSB-021) TaxID=946362 RepID=F2UE93_SALR5|nr:uncharacterized protein PTSG_12540 [Salpingoeca rosetta]EGD74943.1 hypothetical protein PTSG_12540 [Salpingoeca rosetta]|eukprot:XP_004992588.1 hypothetical protein PTSG_12540 [Salpingoeca rosetta]